VAPRWSVFCTNNTPVDGSIIYESNPKMRRVTGDSGRNGEISLAKCRKFSSIRIDAAN
jgi:hypothetical protein